MASVTKEKIQEYLAETHSLDASALIAWALRKFGPEGVSLACSFSIEDTTLVHMAHASGLPFQALVLDTGRLHEETYQTMERCRSKYHMEFDVYFPNFEKVEHLLRTKGSRSFYDTVENRKECCGIRKVEPLGRALKSKQAWMTGLRREQSVTRSDIERIEIDEANGGLVKLNPIVDWTTEQLNQYAKDNEVVIHPLHAQGFPSIGCAPCTRAIQPGEDFRAGRWWWENPDHKECGIHWGKR